MTNRIVIVALTMLLFAGCISLGERAIGNETAKNASGGNASGSSITNGTSNITGPPPTSIRFNAGKFSFLYPANMEIDTSPGIFTGTHMLNGTTGEILVVTYLDTAKTYGANKEGDLKADPSEAASEFLREDRQSDSAGLLSDANSISGASSFALSRDGFGARQNFTIRFNENGNTYHGYAADIYFPQNSLLMKVRVIAIDPDLAKKIYDDFILSLRLE